MSDAPSLERRLGPFDAAAIVVSNVIGGGIFFVPILVAQFVGDARAMLLVWAIGGACAFMGAMAYAELAALRPRAGGEYVCLVRIRRREPGRGVYDRQHRGEHQRDDHRRAARL